MKYYSFFQKFISLMLVLTVIGTVGVMTAFAEPEDGAEEQQEIVAEETPQETPEETPQEEQIQEEPQEQAQEQAQEEPQEQAQEQAQEEPQEQVQEQAQEEPQQQAQEQAQEEPQQQAQETPQDNAQEQVQDNADDVQDQDTEQESGEQNEWYDYIYSYDDAVSSYLEPENLGDLPKALSGQVQEATAVPMPTVAVSDASMLSGIVMWLCVALGIAVIVGVLVSKRTRRRGA